MERNLQRISRPSSGSINKQQHRRPEESDPKLTGVAVSTQSTLDGQHRDDSQKSQDGTTSIWYDRIPSRRVPLVRDEKLTSSRMSSGRDTMYKPSSGRDERMDVPSSGRDTADRALFGRDRPPSERNHMEVSSRMSSGRDTIYKPSSGRDERMDMPSSGRDTADRALFGRDRPPSERDHALVSSRLSSGRDMIDKTPSGRDIFSSGEEHQKRLDVPYVPSSAVVRDVEIRRVGDEVISHPSQVAQLGVDVSPERVRGKYNVEDARVNFACITTRAQQYRQNQNYDKAESLLKEHLLKSQVMLGARHSETVNLMSHLAKTYFKHRKFAEAEELYKECLQITKSSLGAHHPDTRMAKSSLLTVYNQLGKPLRPTSARKLGSREI